MKYSDLKVGLEVVVGDKDLLVDFDDGVYLRTSNDHSWYVGNYRKIGIIRNIEGA
jgi:hypothetical protein